MRWIVVVIRHSEDVSVVSQVGGNFENELSGMALIRQLGSDKRDCEILILIVRTTHRPGIARR